MSTKWILFLFFAMLSAPAFADEQPWLRIDTHNETLMVIQHNHVVAKLTDISVGRGGVTHNRVRGDDRTPLGQFRVGWIDKKSPYHLFFGLDYPNRNYAERAYHNGLISRHTFNRIVQTLADHTVPPQNTALGGYIGIHGVGRGNPRIQRLLNWTEGCIAVTNAQIDRLAPWIAVGTRVVIE